MAEPPFTESDLASVENVFDIFLLLFDWLKEREGQALSLKFLSAPEFEASTQRAWRMCQTLAQDDDDFRDRGVLHAHGKREFVGFLTGIGGEAALASSYGALIGIDASFPPPPRQPRQPLNRRFRDRGRVRFLPSANLLYEGASYLRGYAETGTRIENKLKHLTVCLPQRNGYSTEMVPLSDELMALFDDRPSPTFGIVPFRAQDDLLTIEVTTRIPDGGALFTARSLDHAGATARLRATLDAAVEHGVDVLVFPELSFTGSLLAELQRQLDARGARAPKLIVAGTSHVAGQNVCHVLGPDGRILWQQAKMNRFVILPGELQTAPEPIPEQGGTEDIDISDRVVRIADFPFGRVAVLVCLDFILPETYSVLANMQVNCIIVPAMTPNSRRFDTLAWAHAAASRATTVFCNAPNCPGFGPDARSFVYTPIQGPDPQFIGVQTPWERHMLVFSASPWRHETVPLYD